MSWFLFVLVCFFGYGCRSEEQTAARELVALQGPPPQALLLKTTACQSAVSSPCQEMSSIGLHAASVQCDGITQDTGLSAVPSAYPAMTHSSASAAILDTTSPVVSLIANEDDAPCCFKECGRTLHTGWRRYVNRFGSTEWVGTDHDLSSFVDFMEWSPPAASAMLAMVANEYQEDVGASSVFEDGFAMVADGASAHVDRDGDSDVERPWAKRKRLKRQRRQVMPEDRSPAALQEFTKMVLYSPDTALTMVEYTVMNNYKDCPMGHAQGFVEFLRAWRNLVSYFMTCKAACAMMSEATSRNWPVWHLLVRAAAREISMKELQIDVGRKMRKTESEKLTEHELDLAARMCSTMGLPQMSDTTETNVLQYAQAAAAIHSTSCTAALSMKSMIQHLRLQWDRTKLQGRHASADSIAVDADVTDFRLFDRPHSEVEERVTVWSTMTDGGCHIQHVYIQVLAAIPPGTASAFGTTFTYDVLSADNADSALVNARTTPSWRVLQHALGWTSTQPSKDVIPKLFWCALLAFERMPSLMQCMLLGMVCAIDRTCV